jgi:hypothetical protein
VDFGAPEDGAAPLQLDRAASLRRLVSALADPANRVPQGEVTAPPADLAAPGDQAGRWAAEYAGSAKLQGEFSSADTYTAYKRAEQSGRVRFGRGLSQPE